MLNTYDDANYIKACLKQLMKYPEIKKASATLNAVIDAAQRIADREVKDGKANN